MCVFCFGPRCFGIAIQSRSVGRLSERVGPLDIYVSVVEDCRKIVIIRFDCSRTGFFATSGSRQPGEHEIETKSNRCVRKRRAQRPMLFQRLHSAFGERKNSIIWLARGREGNYQEQHRNSQGIARFS